MEIFASEDEKFVFHEIWIVGRPGGRFPFGIEPISGETGDGRPYLMVLTDEDLAGEAATLFDGMQIIRQRLDASEFVEWMQWHFVEGGFLYVGIDPTPGKKILIWGIPNLVRQLKAANARDGS